MKNLFVLSTKLSKYKFFELQIYVGKPYIGSLLDWDVDLLKLNESFFSFYFSLLGDIFKFQTFWNRKSDHAGWVLEFNCLGFFFETCIRDSRHWNYDNDKWEKYN